MKRKTKHEHARKSAPALTNTPHPLHPSQPRGRSPSVGPVRRAAGMAAPAFHPGTARSLSASSHGLVGREALVIGDDGDDFKCLSRKFSSDTVILVPLSLPRTLSLPTPEAVQLPQEEDRPSSSRRPADSCPVGLPSPSSPSAAQPRHPRPLASPSPQPRLCRAPIRPRQPPI